MRNDEPFEAGYRVVGRGSIDGHSARAGVRMGRLRLESGRDRACEFDEEGRLVREERNGHVWRTTFDLRLLESEVRGRGPGRRLRRGRDPLEDLERIAAAHAPARRFLVSADDIDEQSRAWLARAGGWTLDALRQDRRRIRELYQPIPVLPPDQYASLVLQITEGCPWDRCTFCDFYRGVDHRIRSDQEFDTHFRGVLEHVGRSVRRYRRIFLGQANALLVPAETLQRRLDRIAERLPLCPPELPADRRRAWRREHPESVDGIYCFVDAFHRLPEVESLWQLHQRGLRRAYVGLESGSSGVLEILGKPLDPDQALDLVRRLHEAGVGVGVIVLVGAGGERGAREHERKTVECLRAMQLRAGDQIYLSRLVVHEGSDYQQRAESEGWGALSAEALNRQEDALRRALHSERERGVPIAGYDLEQIASWSPRP